MHRLLLGLPALLLIRSRAVTLSCSAHLALKWAPSRSSLHAFRCAGVAKPAAHLKRCRTGPARFRGAPALVGARPAAAPASGGSSAPAATMDHLYDAHGGMYHHQQQTQYILVDEHDHDHGWPAHSAAMPAVHAGAPGGLAAQQAAAVAHHQQAAEPLGPLPSIHGGYPGKPVAPMMPVGLGDDDEATESEGEHARGAALGWVPQQAPQRRPESTLTATSQQPSPTPSVSVARGASGGAPPPPATKAAPAHRGGRAAAWAQRAVGGAWDGRGRAAKACQAGRQALPPHMQAYLVACTATAALPAWPDSLFVCPTPTTGLQGNEAAGQPDARRPHLQWHRRPDHGF